MTTRHACQYAIVRFLPYAETGEFANVGLVLACPQLGFFGAKLAPAKRSKRVTDFFDGLDAKLYREAIKYLEAELRRMTRAVEHMNVGAHNAFAEVTRPREALIRFGAPRVIMAADPADTLRKLYGHFVERTFATKEYHEQMLERGIENMLQRAALQEYFTNATIGDDTFNVRIPFVGHTQGGDQIAIKPLNLAQQEPNKILDHGLHWIARLRRLRLHAQLPREMLFAVDQAPTGKQAVAANEVVGELRELGTAVVPAYDEASIIDFARMAQPMRSTPLI